MTKTTTIGLALAATGLLAALGLGVLGGGASEIRPDPGTVLPADGTADVTGPRNLTPIETIPPPAPEVRTTAGHVPAPGLPMEAAERGEFGPWTLTADGKLIREKLITLEYKDGRRVQTVARITATPIVRPQPVLRAGDVIKKRRQERQKR